MNKILRIFRNRNLVFLVLIVVLGFLIRVNKLTEIPVSLYWDEVSIGYNAYSISTNLHDEHGKFLPILFQAYDDYKLPLYIYVDAVFVKAMSLNALSVRLPSAIFGTLSVLLTFLLVRSLFLKIKIKDHINSETVALIASLLISISPWAVQFSRGGFEANLALFLTILGTYLLLKIEQGYKFLLLSLFSYALAFYTYRGVFIFLPIFITGLFVIWRKDILKLGFLKVIIAISIFLLLIFPVVRGVIFETNGRISQTSLTNEVNEIANKKFQDGTPVDKKIVYVQVFLKNYLAEISPDFLFLKGDPNGRHSTRGMGVMYLWELPFVLLGIFFVVKKFPLKLKQTFLLWILAFPLPSAFTTPSPHALRSLIALPLPQILVALGVYFSYKLINNRLKKYFILFLSIIVFSSLMLYGYLYKTSNVLTAGDWGDGYRQLYEYLIPLENNYDKIIVSGHYWQPYSYALFYKKYSPVEYQTKGSPQAFGKYYFGGTAWDTNVGRPELNDLDLKSIFPKDNVLIALSPEEYQKMEAVVNKTDEITNNNGKIVFIIATFK